MIRYLICFVILWSPAMAKDGTMPQQRLLGLEPTPGELRAATPQGQDIERLTDLYLSGDAKAFDDALDEVVRKRGIDLENNSYLKRFRKQ
jgi:hypothetical protein